MEDHTASLLHLSAFQATPPPHPGDVPRPFDPISWTNSLLSPYFPPVSTPLQPFPTVGSPPPTLDAASATVGTSHVRLQLAISTLADAADATVSRLAAAGRANATRLATAAHVAKQLRTTLTSIARPATREDDSNPYVAQLEALHVGASRLANVVELLTVASTWEKCRATVGGMNVNLNKLGDLVTTLTATGEALRGVLEPVVMERTLAAAMGEFKSAASEALVEALGGVTVGGDGSSHVALRGVVATCRKHGVAVHAVQVVAHALGDRFPYAATVALGGQRGVEEEVQVASLLALIAARTTPLMDLNNPEHAALTRAATGNAYATWWCAYLTCSRDLLTVEVAPLLLSTMGALSRNALVALCNVVYSTSGSGGFPLHSFHSHVDATGGWDITHTAATGAVVRRVACDLAAAIVEQEGEGEGEDVMHVDRAREATFKAVTTVLRPACQRWEGDVAGYLTAAFSALPSVGAQGSTGASHSWPHVAGCVDAFLTNVATAVACTAELDMPRTPVTNAASAALQHAFHRIADIAHARVEVYSALDGDAASGASGAVASRDWTAPTAAASRNAPSARVWEDELEPALALCVGIQLFTSAALRVGEGDLPLSASPIEAQWTQWWRAQWPHGSLAAADDVAEDLKTLCARVAAGAHTAATAAVHSSTRGVRSLRVWSVESAGEDADTYSRSPTPIVTRVCELLLALARAAAPHTHACTRACTATRAAGGDAHTALLRCGVPPASLRALSLAAHNTENTLHHLRAFIASYASMAHPALVVLGADDAASACAAVGMPAPTAAGDDHSASYHAAINTLTRVAASLPVAGTHDDLPACERDALDVATACATLWVHSLAHAAACSILREWARITSLTSEGAAQMSADFEYMCSVWDAMGCAPPRVLLRFMDMVRMSARELVALVDAMAAASGSQEEATMVRLVARMRAVVKG